HDPESMLRAVRLVTQWVRIQRQLPEGWTDARLRLTLASEKGFARASFLLGPLTPGRSGNELHFHAARGGGGPSASAVQRALARVDRARVRGTLELVGADAREAAPDATPGSLAAAWDEAIAELPPDWSDIYAEVELTSSDNLDPAAIELGPL